MNPPNGQAPIDYLNQIAPQAPKKPLFEFTLGKVAIVGIILIILVIIISVISGALANGQKEPWQRLSARVAATTILATDATDNIKNSQLRSLNSDLKLFLTNTARDIEQPLLARGITVEKIPASILAQESSESVASKLEDGRLNNKFDITYAREMSYQLTLLLSLLEQLAGSSSGATQEMLQTAHQNLTPIHDGMQGFGATNE